MATTTAEASPRAANMTSVTEEMIEAAATAKWGNAEVQEWLRGITVPPRSFLRPAIEAALSASPAAQTELPEPYGWLVEPAPFGTIIFVPWSQKYDRDRLMKQGATVTPVWGYPPAALAAPSAPQPTEPVAWLRTEKQIHPDYPKRVDTTADPEVATLWRRHEYTESLVPLYAAPSAPQPALASEPVAWRWTEARQPWVYTERNPTWLEAPQFTVEPLYASPVAQQRDGGGILGAEDLASSAASLLEVFADQFKADGDTASWSMASVMAEKIRVLSPERKDQSNG